MKKGSPKAIYLKDYRPPAYFIRSVDLRFELYEDRTLVHAELTIEANEQAKISNDILELHGEQLKLLQLKLDGNELKKEAYSVHAEGLQIKNVPTKFKLTSTVEIDPAKNTALEGLYLSSGNYCTQCEAEGFRKITYYIDRPDVMAIFSVRIEADQSRCPVLLSNGNRITSGQLDKGRHYTQWHDPFPKPCYLFALVAGDLACRRDQYTTLSQRVVDLEIYTEAHNVDKCGHALVSLKKAMQWDEQTFGLEYDLDTYMIVAVDDFNMGAMENKGLNIFNSKYVLASSETATDDDYMGIEGVIAHEYFHNWTGNRVTCRDWFQLSLKEGLTVFRDQEFTSDVTSRSVKRIQDVRYLRTYQFAEDAGPMAHPVRPASYVEINNFYTLTVYEKGAEVVRMYHTLLGQDGFKRGLQHYLSVNDGQAVTTDDFANAMATTNNFDLGNFLHWYSQSGTPTLKIEGKWNSDTAEYVLKVQQEIPPQEEQALPYLIPLQLSLLDPQGEIIALQLKNKTVSNAKSCVLQVRELEQKYIFCNITQPPTPSLLQGFSAPVKLQYDYSSKDYAFLMKHDCDTFNRWEAGQQFASDWLLTAIKAIQNDEVLPAADEFVAALKVVLQDSKLDPAFVAEVMTLPAESYLAERITPIDVDTIYKARCELQKQISTALQDELLHAYRLHSGTENYQYNAADMAKRKLAAVSLYYLCAFGNEHHIELAKRQYRKSNNMTDTMAALVAINDLNNNFREEAMHDFAQRWRNDPLVMDKWFSLHARSRRTNTLSTVKELLNHACFSIKNPNKVRALIGVFVMGNPTAFHAVDGSGYQFLTEQVIRLNAINPQVAARMVKPLIDWKKYASDRQQLMRASLNEILNTPKLSRDVYEIVDRGLQH